MYKRQLPPILELHALLTSNKSDIEFVSGIRSPLISVKICPDKKQVSKGSKTCVAYSIGCWLHHLFALPLRTGGCDRFSAIDFFPTRRSPLPNRMFRKLVGRRLSESIVFNFGSLSVVDKPSFEKRSHLCPKPKSLYAISTDHAFVRQQLSLIHI